MDANEIIAATKRVIAEQRNEIKWCKEYKEYPIAGRPGDYGQEEVVPLDDVYEMLDTIETAINGNTPRRNMDRFNSGDNEHDLHCALGTYMIETADPETGEPEMSMTAFARWMFEKVKEEESNDGEK